MRSEIVASISPTENVKPHTVNVLRTSMILKGEVAMIRVSSGVPDIICRLILSVKIRRQPNPCPLGNLCSQTVYPKLCCPHYLFSLCIVV